MSSLYLKILIDNNLILHQKQITKLAKFLWGLMGLILSHSFWDKPNKNDVFEKGWLASFLTCIFLGLLG